MQRIGSGKDIKGNCFKCGRKGHKAAECRAINHIDGWTLESSLEYADTQKEAEGSGQNEAPKDKGIGSVWMLAANVNSYWPKPNSKVEVEKPKMKQVKKNWIKVSNRFTFDEEEEIDEAAGDEIDIDVPPGLEQIQIEREVQHPKVLHILGKQAEITEKKFNKKPKNKSKKSYIGMVEVGVKRQEPRRTLAQIRKENIVKVMRDLETENEMHATCQPCEPRQASRLEMHATCQSCEPRQVSRLEACQINGVGTKPDLVGEKCGIMFHVTTAKKMLVSVERLTAAGNLVTFGPTNEHCFIENLQTQRRIMMKKKGGVYEVEVMFQIGETWKKGTLTIDSGAEENVMPKGWYDQIELMEKKDGIRFMGADGSDLGNYGRKLMEFIPVAEFNAGFPRRA